MEGTIAAGATRDNWSRMWDWIAGVIVSPAETFREIGARAAWPQALALVAALGLINALIQAAGALTGAGAAWAELRNVSREFGTGVDPFAGGAGMATGLAVATAFTEVIWRPILWTAAALVVYLVAYLLGGRGDFVRLWAVLGFAAVPEFLVAPLSAAVALLGVLSPPLSALGSLALLPVNLLVFIWLVVLYVLGVRETMSLTTERATAAVLLPIAVILLFILLAICVIAALLFAVVGGTAG